MAPIKVMINDVDRGASLWRDQTDPHHRHLLGIGFRPSASERDAAPMIEMWDIRWARA